jgi:outer membrane protein OmpA-like peptidoglycan-associated protein
MRSIFLSVLGFASALCLVAVGAHAADLPGSKDPAFLKRFQGAEIVHYVSVPYAALTTWGPDPAKPPKGLLTSSAEGQITRIIYHLPSGHTVLEVQRNYEQALRDAGFAITYEMQGDRDTAYYVGNPLYYQNWEKVQSYDWTTNGIYEMTENSYMTAKGTVDGKDVTVAVWIGAFVTPRTTHYEKAVPVTPDQPVVLVDVLTAKPVVNQMVVVKAADMADALDTKGFIDLYGVYFDTDKAEVKPESTATLDEIASLLKIDRSLKLEISGHTDNTGSKDHNLKLSQARADAVKTILVSKYGIDAGRLTTKGYGDTKPVVPNTSEANKAKNRRVELRKL